MTINSKHCLLLDLAVLVRMVFMRPGMGLFNSLGGLGLFPQDNLLFFSLKAAPGIFELTKEAFIDRAVIFTEGKAGGNIAAQKTKGDRAHDNKANYKGKTRRFGPVLNKKALMSYPSSGYLF